MNERATQNASVEKIKNGWRLGIHRGDSSHYRDAQLDDYYPLPRHKFPHHSIGLSLSARASSVSIPGTWGFGLWNDPFGMSLGFGGVPFRLPALPNAAWFFHASPQNYLSFRNGLDTGWGKTRNPTRPAVGNGFLAQTFRSPKFHPLMMLAGLALPFSRKLTRKLMSKVIGEDGVSLGVDVTEWHSYQLEWRSSRVVCHVDNVQVFESPVSSNPPMGVVIWIDNQYAAFTPEGKIGFGVLENTEPAWIEIRDLKIRQ